MKKFLSVILVLSIFLTMSACGIQKQEKSGNNQKGTSNIKGLTPEQKEDMKYFKDGYTILNPDVENDENLKNMIYIFQNGKLLQTCKVIENDFIDISQGSIIDYEVINNTIYLFLTCSTASSSQDESFSGVYAIDIGSGKATQLIKKSEFSEFFNRDEINNRCFKMLKNNNTLVFLLKVYNISFGSKLNVVTYDTEDTKKLEFKKTVENGSKISTYMENLTYDYIDENNYRIIDQSDSGDKGLSSYNFCMTDFSISDEYICSGLKGKIHRLTYRNGKHIAFTIETLRSINEISGRDEYTDVICKYEEGKGQLEVARLKTESDSGEFDNSIYKRNNSIYAEDHFQVGDDDFFYFYDTNRFIQTYSFSSDKYDHKYHNDDVNYGSAFIYCWNWNDKKYDIYNIQDLEAITRDSKTN